MNLKQIKNKKPFAKGHRGIIYIGTYKKIKVAIKKKNPKSKAINRIQNEIKFLKILNKKGIGPKILFHGKNYFVYKFIKGEFILNYIKNNKKTKIKQVLKQVLKQCHIMDQLKITKEEMHHPYKHVIINKKVNLIDFERVHYTEKPHNVTQFLQYIMSLKQILEKKGIKVNKRTIRSLAKQYKKDYKISNLKNAI